MTCARPAGTPRMWRTADAVHIDVRDLEPPEPMIAILRAIDEGKVDTVLLTNGRCVGVRTDVGDLEACAVVLTTGTFLNGLCHEGSKQTVAARHGDRAVFGLSAFLKELGLSRVPVGAD